MGRPSFSDPPPSRPTYISRWDTTRGCRTLRVSPLMNLSVLDIKQGLDRVLDRHCTLAFGPEAHSPAIRRTTPNSRERHPDPTRCQHRSLGSRAQRCESTHAHAVHHIQRTASFQAICGCRQGMRASQNAKASHCQASERAASRQCLVN